MNKFKYKLAAFMNGRYGHDQLGRLLVGISIACILLSFILARPFYYVGIVFLAISYYRMFSKNIIKRDSENKVYKNFIGKIKTRFKNIKRRISERKTHRFFKCRKCSQTIRIPKGKGNISISCPKCKNEFRAKT